MGKKSIRQKEENSFFLFSIFYFLKTKYCSWFIFAVCGFSFFSLSGCATYQSKIGESRNLLRNGMFSEALEKLKILAESPGNDQLVYLLDYGTALQMNGQFSESNQILLKADKLVDINDYHSVSNIVSATLGSEDQIQYKGESYEKFLINTMLAVNYLMLGQQDEAIVEARRINEKILKMKLDGRAPYELSPFANYLSAMLWEADQKWDDAYIDYEQAYKLDPGNPFIEKDLIRSARKAKRQEVYEKWKKEFSSVSEDPKWYDRNSGELVVIAQQGWGPEKRTRPETHRFPMLRPQFSRTQSGKVFINDEEKAQTSLVYNVESMAMRTLEADYGALVARRIGGVVAKAVAADQIRQKNQLLGELAWIAMNIADRADLRQWSTLPQTFQLSRTLLPAGTYRLRIQGIDSYGTPTADILSEQTIKISAGKKTFVNWRSVR